MNTTPAPIRTILVRPKFAANIGSCARVIANFNFPDCHIVAPLCDPFGADRERALQRAVPPSDQFLLGMKTDVTVADALDDCTLAIGFTRRMGSKRAPVPFPSLLPELQEHLRTVPGARIALVFGNEETGLLEEELRPCTHLAILPTADLIPSMNLSHAVTIVLSRLFELQVPFTVSTEAETPATLGQLEELFAHWEQTLVDLGMTEGGNPGRFMLRIRRIFQRTRLLEREVVLLRGFLSKIRTLLQR